MYNTYTTYQCKNLHLWCSSWRSTLSNMRFRPSEPAGCSIVSKLSKSSRHAMLPKMFCPAPHFALVQSFAAPRKYHDYPKATSIPASLHLRSAGHIWERFVSRQFPGDSFFHLSRVESRGFSLTLYVAVVGFRLSTICHNGLHWPDVWSWHRRRKRYNMTGVLILRLIGWMGFIGFMDCTMSLLYRVGKRKESCT